MTEQMDFTERKPPITKFPGPSDKRYHAETMIAYLTNIERLALLVGDAPLPMDKLGFHAELLDNCRAAMVLARCL